jgi:hypothetical protein
MANAKPKKNSEPGIMDVSKPGKAKPSATSKPIIITNRPLLQDPMVVDDEAKQDDSPLSPAKSKVTIKPISVSDGEDENAAPVTVTTKPVEPAVPTTDSKDEAEPAPKAEVETTEPVVEEPAEEAPPAVADKPPEKAETEEKPEPAAADTEPPASESAKETAESETADEAPDKTDKTAPMSPEEQEAAAKKVEEEKTEHTAAIQKLVDNEQYFLPINSVESRKVKRFIALGAALIILLAVAWVDVALDAGLVQLGGLKPVTHFFTAKSASTTSNLVPTVTTKTYTTLVAKLSFRYQSNWKLASSGSTPQKDVVALSPTAQNPLASVAVSFLTEYTLGKSTYNVNFVHYQKLARTVSGDVYLRDMVYQDSFGHINLVASLGNNNSVKAGQKLQSVDQDFLNPDGKTRSLFAVTTFKAGKGTVGFASVAEAEQFISSAQYQQARAILLSTAPAKS